MSIRLFIFLAALLIPAFAYADGSGRAPYVTQKQFLFSGDKHEQARTWATCAALYNTLSGLYQLRDNPAQAKEFNNLGNGAEVAVAMTFVVSAFGASLENVSPSRFNATWDFAKVAMKEMPSAQQTTISANIEMGMKGTTELKNEVQAVIDGATICIKNRELQQTYINIWRELATSGLLTLQKE